MIYNSIQPNNVKHKRLFSSLVNEWISFSWIIGSSQKRGFAHKDEFRFPHSCRNPLLGLPRSFNFSHVHPHPEFLKFVPHFEIHPSPLKWEGLCYFTFSLFPFPFCLLPSLPSLPSCLLAFLFTYSPFPLSLFPFPFCLLPSLPSCLLAFLFTFSPIHLFSYSAFCIFHFPFHFTLHTSHFTVHPSPFTLHPNYCDIVKNLSYLSTWVILLLGYVILFMLS